MQLFHDPTAFFDRLRERMEAPLPGEDAQNRMTSRGRRPVEDYLREYPNHRRSAVLLPLYPYQGEVYTMLIKRPAYDGVHSGQLALPGGAEEPEDGSPEQTALREAFEEVGLEAHQGRLLGALTPLYIPPSNFLVRPFMMQLHERPEWKPSPDEVEAVLEIPLQVFLDQRIKDRRKIAIGNGMSIDAPCYIIEGNVLWGATAMMFSEVEVLLEEITAAG